MADTITETELRKTVLDIIDASGLSQNKWAASTQIAGTALSDFLCGRRRPPPKLLSLMRLKAVLRYTPSSAMPMKAKVRIRGAK